MSVAFTNQLRPLKNSSTAKSIRCIDFVWSNLGHECPRYVNSIVVTTVGWTFMSVGFTNQAANREITARRRTLASFISFGQISDMNVQGTIIPSSSTVHQPMATASTQGR